MTRGILFVIDCLRYDAFPEWFFENRKGVFSKFETACNTPMSFNSIIMGRNIYDETPQPSTEQMIKLYLKSPSGKPFYQELKYKGVNCYYSSEYEGLMGSHVWWSNSEELKAYKNFNDLKPPYFLFLHTFVLHGPQNPQKFYRGNFEQRKQFHAQYDAKADLVFNWVTSVLDILKPDLYAVMGDHGEEFWDEVDDGEDKIVGHGSFYDIIKTDNVRYTGLFVNSQNFGVVTDYSSLYKMLQSWYK